MVIGGVLEWVLGNSFSSIVFCSFGGFWFSYGATLIPAFASYASYAPVDAKSGAAGLQTTGFNASLGKSTRGGKKNPPKKEKQKKDKKQTLELPPGLELES